MKIQIALILVITLLTFAQAFRAGNQFTFEKKKDKKVDPLCMSQESIENILALALNGETEESSRAQLQNHTWCHVVQAFCSKSGCEPPFLCDNSVCGCGSEEHS
jgi:hypothetical protein